MATYYQIEMQRLFIKFANKKFTPRDCETYARLRRNFITMYPDCFLSLSRGKRIDYEIKSVIFEHYSYELLCVRKYRYWQYLEDEKLSGSWSLEKFVDSLDHKEKLKWQEYILVASRIEYQLPGFYGEMIKIINADRQRRLRLKKRIGNILEKGNAYFITLTFSDDALANTQPHIRRKYVCELMKSISNDYVGNVDFGKKKGREHYHVVVSTDKLLDAKYKYFKGSGYSADYSSALDSWSKYGKYFIKHCGNADSDANALAKYTCKLTNHAIKETTKRNALIYSR